MARKFKGGVLVAAALGATAFLAPAQGAYAADGCGSGYFKRSDGYLTKSALWEGQGPRNAMIYHTGRVRFCTEDDTFNDDENRRAVIGYPADTYAFQSEIDKNGKYAKFCVQQTIEAHLTGIKTSSSWEIGGTISKSDPSVSFSYSETLEEGTVKVARNAVCGRAAARIFARAGGFTVTAQNESGKVAWVHLTTTITAQYRYKGAKYGDTFPLSEYDFS